MSNPQFTHDDLRTILTDEVGLEVGDLTDKLDVTFADLGLDSLAVVEVQLAVQRRYGVAMPDEEAYAVTTVREALEYVNGRLAWEEAA
jgi:act minimal PKS acyl carrier protein